MSVFGADTSAGRSARALDVFVFFVADVQTGFGPFVAVYLTLNGWSQGSIGQALSVGTAVAAVSQLPGGLVVDALRDKRLAATAAAVAVALGAVLFAVSTAPIAVYAAEASHAFASAALSPAVAAVSLALVGRAALGARLGQNTRLAALGNAFAAAVLGAAGTALPGAGVFWVTAVSVVPGLAALWWVGSGEPSDETAPEPAPSGVYRELAALAADRRVLAFCACVALFHAGNAALLPLASGLMAAQAGKVADLAVSAAVVLPQAIVAVISPRLGRLADRRGVPLVLVAGFAAVPARAALLALVAPNPFWVVAVQALDGIGAATFGIMVPLVAAALTRGTGRFNLCLGAFGLAVSAGATLSTFMAGHLVDTAGSRATFLALAGFGAAGAAVAWFAAPRAARGAP